MRALVVLGISRRSSGWLARTDGGVGAPMFFGALVDPFAFPRVDAERSLSRRLVVGSADGPS